LRGFTTFEVVVIQLPELGAALILGEHEARAALGGLRGNRRGGFAVEGDLLAHAHWSTHAVNLICFSKTGRDHHGAVRLPTSERCAARVLVARQTRCQIGRQRRQAFRNAIAHFDAFSGVTGVETDQADGDEAVRARAI